jgi:hypothetical protein
MKTKLKNIVIIIISIIVSWVLAMTTDLSGLELGALANLFFPPMLGIVTVLIYVVLGLVLKRYRLVIVIILCLLNISLGIIFHFFNF